MLRLSCTALKCGGVPCSSAGSGREHAAGQRTLHAGSASRGSITSTALCEICSTSCWAGLREWLFGLLRYGRVGVQQKKQPASHTTRDICSHATSQAVRLQLRPAVLMSRFCACIDRCQAASPISSTLLCLSHPRAQRLHSRVYVKRRRISSIYCCPLPERSCAYSCLSIRPAACHRLAASRVVVACRRVRHARTVGLRRAGNAIGGLMSRRFLMIREMS